VGVAAKEFRDRPSSASVTTDDTLGDGKLDIRTRIFLLTKQSLGSGLYFWPTGERCPSDIMRNLTNEKTEP